MRSVGATLRFACTGTAIILTSAIHDGVGLRDMVTWNFERAPVGLQWATFREAVFIGLLIPTEFTAGLPA